MKDYKIKQYEILSKKNSEETKIVTLSDLNWNLDITKYDINDLIVKINDILPTYTFILGNICNYELLQDENFRDKLSYFFNLLNSISQSIIVFGNNDYKLNKETKNYTNVYNLINFYNQFKTTIINNNFITDNNFNIVGFNKNYPNYSNIAAANHELIELLANLDNIIDKNKFNILITHFELHHLKLKKELLEIFDLILTGTNHKTVKKKFFNFEEEEKDNCDQIVTNDKIFIKTGGVCKEEIGFVKVKKI